MIKSRIVEAAKNGPVGVILGRPETYTRDGLELLTKQDLYEVGRKVAGCDFKQHYWTRRIRLTKREMIAQIVWALEHPPPASCTRCNGSGKEPS